MQIHDEEDEPKRRQLALATKQKRHGKGERLCLMAAAESFHERNWKSMLNKFQKNDEWKNCPVWGLDPAAITAKQKELVGEHPRTPAEQYQADLEYCRAFELLQRSLPISTNIGHWLIHERKRTLQRMKKYEEANPTLKDKILDPTWNGDTAQGESPQSLEQRANALLGYWECQDAAHGVRCERIEVRRLDGTPDQLVAVYEKAEEDDSQHFVFSIHIKPKGTRLIPNVAIREAERRGCTLVSANADELKWTLHDGTPVKWLRVDEADVRLTRGEKSRQDNIARELFKKHGQRQHSRRRCVCGGNECTTDLGQTRVPRIYYKNSTPWQKRRSKYVAMFRASLKIPDSEQSRKKDLYVANHHWPRAFFDSYGSKKPQYLSRQEAERLGMYVPLHRGCRHLLDESTDEVICVPWLTCEEGLAQYKEPEAGPALSEATDQRLPNDSSALQNNGSSEPGTLDSDDLETAVADLMQKITESGPLTDLERKALAHLKSILREDSSEPPPPPPPDTGYTSEEFLSQTKDTCRQFFGYNSRNEMLAWMSVHWPHLKQDVTQGIGIKRGLTPFEECCFTRMFMRLKISIGRLAALWRIGATKASRAVLKWMPRWEYHSKFWCRLTFDRDFLEKCQISGMEQRYGVKISHLVDGTVCQTQMARSSNVMKKTLFNHKISHCGTLAISHVTPTGLCLLSTDMFAGNAEEYDLIRIYRKWWDAYPAGFGRLVDKGFAFFTNIFYKNGSRAIYPAFLKKESKMFSLSETKQLTKEEKKEAREQSKERYVVETFFSRVKSFLILHGTVVWEHTRYINAAFLTACAAANQLKPLKEPISWHSLAQDFEAAKALKRE